VIQDDKETLKDLRSLFSLTSLKLNELKCRQRRLIVLSVYLIFDLRHIMQVFWRSAIHCSINEVKFLRNLME